jgi:hypothetical protein
MNKAWITALSIAGIAGSASAAYAGLSVNGNEGAPAEAQGLPAAATTLAPVAAPSATPAGSPTTATYQVGAAGTVTVTNDNGIVSVQSAMPSPGWTVQGYTSPAGHVEVRFVNALQALTFNADVVNGEMVASFAEAPTPPSTDVTSTEVPVTEAPATIPVPAPLPAVPAAPAAAAPQAPQTPQAPSHAATTAPSSHGGSSASNGGSHHGDDGDDEGEGDYENEEDDD